MQLVTLKNDSSESEVISVLERDGAVVIEGILSDTDLELLTQDAERYLSKTPNCSGNFFGFETKRVGTMVAKSVVCKEMAVHPTIISVMDHFLLPNCTQYQLSASQLISILPGERQQIIHADDPMYPFHKENDMEVMINVMWAIDDFTEQNGATHIVPGSNHWERGERQPKPEEITQGVMSKGSCLIWLGSSYHGGGANTSELPRRGIVMSYALGWLKAQENYFLSIPMDKVKNYSKQLQQLLGYFVHYPNVNTVDGRDPSELLNGTIPEYVEYQQFIPSEAVELIEQFYTGKDVSATESVYKHESTT